MKSRTKKLTAIICILVLAVAFSVMLAGCNQTWENNIEYKVEDSV